MTHNVVGTIFEHRRSGDGGNTAIVHTHVLISASNTELVLIEWMVVDAVQRHAVSSVIRRDGNSENTMQFLVNFQKLISLIKGKFT